MILNIGSTVVVLLLLKCKTGSIAVRDISKVLKYKSKEYCFFIKGMRVGLVRLVQMIKKLLFVSLSPLITTPADSSCCPIPLKGAGGI